MIDIQETSLSLRKRIVLAVILLVTVTSAIFAVAVWKIKVGLEEVVFGHMVDSQLELLRQATDDLSSIDTDLLNGWVLYAGSDLQQLPGRLQELSAGSYHSLSVEDQYLQVRVSGEGLDKVVLTYDITEWEQQEHWVLEIMLFGALLVLVIAAVSGVKAASTILSPLQRLTSSLNDIKPQQRGVRLSAEYNGKEVAQIAQAFDRYMERLDEFVSREKLFTQAASHELRTPLSVVMGATEVLESQPDIKSSSNESVHRALSRINRACHDMQGFMEVSLLLSRESAHPVESDEAINLSELVSQIIDEYRTQLNDHNIRVEQHFINEIPLYQSESLLQVIVSNVIRNAIQHTHDGEIQVIGSDTTLKVIDTGSGISDEHLSQVFDGGFSTRPGGTGLGLSLVRRLCDRLGWKVSIDSQVGSGTCVSIRFEHHKK
ncbi:sensor histidine kinase [Pseudohongiella nitratireducens]|uniref:histidine kinase n=1 Tax=Pseudohongiella nitratireducens TaxID=1768907 RepID=A0A916QKD7_9GAMM|nr:HAMP domain-containing sensor histidine kinase [Pseudohongiella nitratireducens]MDF1623993.1 HAMP domain-containing sensor histidine kinase [Pseudohongiella nitratireducens]GFZ79517.1 sensor histidine kinase [Pseudohongiella nitratireducens]|tara:strand:- start:3203 stop:4495 length:1293 start_codon:yes stop_codon:yes gene_type:complete